MAPERPRSVGYDIPSGARIIEREPDSEVREVPIPKKRGRSKKLTFGIKLRNLFGPVFVRKVRPKSILKHTEPNLADAAYVEVREPRQQRPSFIYDQRRSEAEFVPLPGLLPSSPRHRAGYEAPLMEMRSPRSAPLIHSESSPRRRHSQRRASSPLPSRVCEVETVRVRRFDNTDRDRARRHRARIVEEEIRAEHERRPNADHNRLQQERVLEEREAYLQRGNARLARERRLAQLENEVLERERELERRRVSPGFGHPQSDFPPARGGDVLRPTTDRGADVIREAQARGRVRRGEQILYHSDGRRIDPNRYY
jgi:hypothetical protein